MRCFANYEIRIRTSVVLLGRLISWDSRMAGYLLEKTGRAKAGMMWMTILCLLGTVI